MPILACCVLNLPAHARDVAWPRDEWQKKSPAAAGFSNVRLKAFLDFAHKKQMTFSTDSVVIVRDGYLVHESYANGYKRDQKHALWSLGKTMINALVGILEREGSLKRDDPVRRHYPAIDRAGTKDMTISDLLWMSSGLEWIEEDKENLLQSDPWFAFYTKGSYADMPAFVAQRAQSRPAGQKFNYSSGDSALLVAAMRGAIGESRYLSFADTELFQKTGMRTVAIERDLAGNLSLQGLGYASPLDIARLGLLYLRGGDVEGEKLWPADWLQFTSQMAPSQRNLPDPNDRNLQNNQAYGAHIWLNKKRKGDKTLPYPELPENALLGLGTRGQILLVLPDQKTIVVRTATDTELFLKNRKNYRHEFFKLFMAALKGGGR